ncbi:N-lysine methyltransferase KMT5A-like isoform X1 [Crassostrea virginica]
MSKRRRTKPIDETRKFINQNKDPPDFFVDRFEEKGRSIRTSKFRQRGDFLLQYAGENISKKVGETREKKSHSVYRYFFSNGCIDATRESSRLGRLNYGEPNERNCVTKRVDSMHLCLFATRDIDEGEELLYEYGVKSLPWMQENHWANFNQTWHRTFLDKRNSSLLK